MILYHIADEAAWRQALETGWYKPASLAQEGFLHGSTHAQLAETLRFHFAQAQQVLVLHIVDRRVKDILRWELAPKRGEEFPHFYGRLSVHAVEDVSILNRRPDGTWELPPAP